MFFLMFFAQDLVRALHDRSQNRLDSLSRSEEETRHLQLGRSKGPRVVHQSNKHKKTVDSEDTHEHSEIVDGQVYYWSLSHWSFT